MGRKKANQRYGRIGSVPTLLEVLEDHYDLMTEAERKRLSHRYALHPNTQRDVQNVFRFAQSIQSHLSSLPVDEEALYQRIVQRINNKEFTFSPLVSSDLARRGIVSSFFNNLIEKWQIWLYFFKKNFISFKIKGKTEWTMQSLWHKFSFPKLSPALAMFSIAIIISGLYWLTPYELFNGLFSNKKNSYQVTQMSLTGSMWIGRQLYHSSQQKDNSLEENFNKKNDEKNTVSMTQSLDAVHKHGSLRMGKDSFAMIHVCEQVEMFLTGGVQVGIHCAQSGFRAGQKQFKIGHGLALFQVPPQKSGEEVIIQQPFYKMKVIGTRFIIHEANHFSRMILLEGIVKLNVKKAKNSKQNEFIVKAGTIITLYHKDQQVENISWHLVDLDKYAAYASDKQQIGDKLGLAEKNIFQLLRPFIELPQIIQNNDPFFVQWIRKPGAKDGANDWKFRNGEISDPNQNLLDLFSFSMQGLEQMRIGQNYGKSISLSPDQDLLLRSKKSTLVHFINSAGNSKRSTQDKQNKNGLKDQTKSQYHKRDTTYGQHKPQSNTQIDKGLFNQKSSPLDKVDQTGKTTVISADKKTESTQMTTTPVTKKNLSQTVPALPGKSAKQGDMTGNNKTETSKESKKTSEQKFTTPRILESSSPGN